MPVYVRTHCPRCSKTLNLRPEYLNRLVVCKYCDHRFTSQTKAKLPLDASPELLAALSGTSLIDEAAADSPTSSNPTRGATASLPPAASGSGVFPAASGSGVFPVASESAIFARVGESANVSKAAISPFSDDRTDGLAAPSGRLESAAAAAAPPGPVAAAAAPPAPRNLGVKAAAALRELEAQREELQKMLLRVDSSRELADETARLEEELREERDGNERLRARALDLETDLNSARLEIERQALELADRDALRAERDRLEAERAAAVEDAGRLRDQARDLTGELGRLGEDRDAAVADAGTLRDRLVSLEADRDQLDAERARAVAAAERLRVENDEIRAAREADLARHREDHNRQVGEIERLGLVVADRDFLRAGRDRLEAEKAEAIADAGRLRDQVREIEADRAVVVADADRLRDRLGSLEADRDRLDAERSAAVDDAVRLRERAVTLEAERDTLARDAEEARALFVAERGRVEADRALEREALSREFDSRLAEELGQAEDTERSLRDQFRLDLERLERERSGLRAEIEAESARSRALASECEAGRLEDARRLEAIARLTADLAGTEEAREEATRELDRASRERDELAAELKSREEELRRQRHDREAEHEDDRQALEVLRRELDAAMAGGGAADLAVEGVKEALRAEVESLREQAGFLRDERDAALGAIEEARREQQQSDARRAESEAVLRQEIDRHRSGAERLQVQAETLRRERDAARRQAEAARAAPAREHSGADHSEAAQQRDQLAEHLRRLGDELDQMRRGREAERREHRQAMEALRRELEDARRGAAVGDAESLRAEVESLREQVEALRDERDAALLRAEDAARKQHRLAGCFDQTIVERERVDEERAAAAERTERLLTQVAALEQAAAAAEGKHQSVLASYSQAVEERDRILALQHSTQQQIQKERDGLAAEVERLRTQLLAAPGDGGAGASKAAGRDLADGAKLARDLERSRKDREAAAKRSDQLATQVQRLRDEMAQQKGLFEAERRKHQEALELLHLELDVKVRAAKADVNRRRDEQATAAIAAEAASLLAADEGEVPPLEPPLAEGAGDVDPAATPGPIDVDDPAAAGDGDDPARRLGGEEPADAADTTDQRIDALRKYLRTVHQAEQQKPLNRRLLARLARSWRREESSS